MRKQIIFVLLVVTLTACSIQKSVTNSSIKNSEPAIESKVKQDFTMDELQTQKKITITLNPRLPVVNADEA
jgi:hypothetical protein